MAKKALINKAAAKPKFAVSRLHPVPAVRSSALRVPQVRTLPRVRPGDGSPW